MPLFFFISGFIAYKERIWDWHYFFTMLKKKSKVQIIPTLFFFILFYVICLNENLDSFFTKGPLAYWFTIALFYMFLLYYIVMLASSKYKPWVSDVILITLAFVGACIYIGGMKFYQLERYPIFCPTNLSRYFEFFVLGVLCRKYEQNFTKIISNDLIKAVLLLSFLSIFILSWKGALINYSLIHVFNLEFTLRFLGLFLVFSIFFHYRHFFETNNRTTTTLRFIGRRTLDIYLIHYFFIPDLKPIVQEFISEGVLNPRNTILEFILVMIISLLIVSMCLLASAIIRSNSITGHYLLGAKIPEK